ncbi:MAG TPA: hypothetical protein P5232_00620 [Candidatus Moranbacteria bacterium]|nr:hypothetical protein [Candidatus Moranbacteria bacterium]
MGTSGEGDEINFVRQYDHGIKVVRTKTEEKSIFFLLIIRSKVRKIEVP